MGRTQKQTTDNVLNKSTDALIRSSAAEYLTFVASTGVSDTSFEMRYEERESGKQFGECEL